MKKAHLNKIVAFTLCCLIASATIANAKTIKKVTNYNYSAYYCIDPHAEDPDDSRH